MCLPVMDIKNESLSQQEDLTYHIYHKYKTSNPLTASPTKWSNTLKQFAGSSRRIVLSVFVHFVGLALEGLK